MDAEIGTDTQPARGIGRRISPRHHDATIEAPAGELGHRPMSTTNGMTDEQQNYLQGFVSGTDLARTARSLPTFANTLFPDGAPASPVAAAPAGARPGGPELIHHRAQDRFLAVGK